MASPTLKRISAKPEAELAPRSGDQLLSSTELKLFELFAQLKKPLSVEKFPGSIVLRRFHKGDVICRQGDRGHSAFYIIRSEDMQKLSTLRADRDAGTAPAAGEQPVESEAGKSSTGSTERRVATAYLLSPASSAAPGFLSRFLPGRSRGPQQTQPTFIPNDGPTDIDYRSRQAPMFAGDVFGEMSCMTLAPRSATVVVDQDCYMIEFLRNIFDKVQSDAGYRKRADEIYAQRVLSTHLGRLEVFQGLTEPQLEVLRAAAHLEVVEPGTVICDEGDRSDSVYIIRSGVVQVVRGAHVALRAADVADWPSFCKLIVAGAKDDDSGGVAARHKVATKPTAAGDVSDILAAARGGAGKKSPKSGGAASAADILAAARGGKQSSDVPIVARPAPAASPKSDESKPPEPAQEKSKRPPPTGPADILAAARAAAAKKDKPPAKKNTPAMSTADILAAATKSPAPPSAVGRAESADPNDESGELLQATAPKSTGRPHRLVWDWFTPRVHTAIQSIATDKPSADDRDIVISAINQLICRRDFVASKDVAPVLQQPDTADIVASLPRGITGAKKHWSELDVRVAGTLALRAIYPNMFGQTSGQKGPPDILAYLSRGDCFGEMALILDAPRQATCIAYDHPVGDTKRKPGRVELVRIDGTAFKQLLETSATLTGKVDRLVSRRYVDIVGSDLRAAGTADRSLRHSEEYQDQGLAQGQSLLLIDLDRCTRCGDCVRACQNTHDDGYSRLYLDGPRFDQYLVPSACRQCLNPSCMIGCPVGSIQRGDNGQIEIRDWCIGCKLCADQCPYDSIQMHDLGIIPDQTVGWQFTPSSAVVGKTWQARDYRVRNWAVGVSPFRWTLDLFEQLAQRVPSGAWQRENARLPEPICFRYPFQLSRSQFKKGPFSLSVSSSGFVVQAWLNGVAIMAEEPANPKKKKKLDEIQARLTRSTLRIGENVLAIQVSPPEPSSDGGDFVPKYNQPVLTARLDALPEAGELATATAGEGVDLEVELVKRQAVVCDLCSSLANKSPACVDQCPHEAAIRINSEFEFYSRQR
jgi:Fe-S-cluster-containing dehydrogenase component/CRP-like cAMP-binding protein